jgi:hypothetical protein
MNFLDQNPDRARPAQAGHQLLKEAHRAPGGVGRAGALAAVQHLAGFGPGGEHRVVAEAAGVAVGGTALGMAVHLLDGRVQIDGHRLVPGPGADLPGPAERLGEGPVELADMAEGEAAQEGPERRGGQDPVAEHRWRRGGPQHVGVVDAVTADDDGMHEGHHLGPGTARTRPSRQVHGPVEERLELEVLSE